LVTYYEYTTLRSVSPALSGNARLGGYGALLPAPGADVCGSLQGMAEDYGIYPGAPAQYLSCIGEKAKPVVVEGGERITADGYLPNPKPDLFYL